MRRNTSFQPRRFVTGMVLLLGITPLFAQPMGTVKDKEGNEYKTVKIGEAVWMAENLKTGKFSNGEPITEMKQEVPTNPAFVSSKYKTIPSWCHYMYNPENEKNYGRLYNYAAVQDPRNVCPTGWHVATDADWNAMVGVLGENAVAKLKATEGWPEGSNGTNESGFNALPGGFGNSGNYFDRVGQYAYWWITSVTPNAAITPQRAIFYFENQVRPFAAEKSSNYQSVRCVKNVE